MDTRQVVGYGTLGRSKWHLTQADGTPEPEKKVRVQIIPALAVHEDFQGHGISYVIVDHLIHEAKLLMDEVSPILGLYVHEQNAAAIHVYEKKGFRRFHLRYKDEAGIYLSMVYELAMQ
jgi:GNAT superfamily N-acetyltransferase